MLHIFWKVAINLLFEETRRTLILSKDFTYLRECQRVSVQAGGGAEGQTLADSVLRVEPHVGLEDVTLKASPAPKPRVRH